MRQIIVIGGGASGLAAAIAAAREGAAVTLLEHGKNAGKKLLLTGNGKCNLTNIEQSEEAYRSDESGFVQFALMHFTVRDTIRFFSELGIYTKNKNGGIYPITDQASSVLEVLLLEAVRLRIKIKYNEHVREIRPVQKGGTSAFTVGTETYQYQADAVIMACGSSASALELADGSGYKLASDLGHRIIKPLPALVPLRVKEQDFKKLTGVRAHGRIGLLIDGVYEAEDQGELQFTEYGISGIPAFQVSRFAVRALDRGADVTGRINFLPDFPDEAAEVFWNQRLERSEGKSVSQMLVGLLNKKLIPVVIGRAALRSDIPVSKLTGEQRRKLLGQITDFAITITGYRSYEQAQVCSGGVDCSQVDPVSLESRKVKGIYFAGEILDVDGACGGYNLQWAWSSGMAAGKAAAKG